MQTLGTIGEIISKIKYKPGLFECGFKLGRMGEDGYYVQHYQVIPDCTINGVDANEPVKQKGRKYYISSHCTGSEVFQTLFMAVLAFEEHEARECFYVDGVRPFGPHIHIQALMGASVVKEKRPQFTPEQQKQLRNKAVL
jgi:hypothetical protein